MKKVWFKPVSYIFINLMLFSSIDQPPRMGVWVALFVAALSFSSFVVAESTSEYKNSLPPSGLVDVKLGAFLIDLTKIDGAEQMFNADVLVRIHWNDPRLADSSRGERKMKLDDVWHPHMAIANLRDVKKFLPEVVNVSPDGDVVYRQRLLGDFTARLDLKEFPNDKQTLGIHVVAQGQRPDQVNFLPDLDYTGRAEELTISDWSVGEVQIQNLPYKVPHLGAIAGVRLEFETKRHVSYYFATIFASAAIIVCMAWMVFWMPPEAVNPRISISVTSMLTLIAHRFVVGSELPRLSYLTQMDYFLLGATFMVLLGLIGVVTVARVSNNGRPELGVKLNGVFRWLYPIIFCTMLGIFI